MIRFGDTVRAVILSVLSCALPAGAQQVRILSETYSTWGDITYPDFPGPNHFFGAGPTVRGTITRGGDEYYLTHIELDAYRENNVVYTGVQAYTDWFGLEDYRPVFSATATSSIEFLIEGNSATLSIQSGTDAGLRSWELVNLATGWSLPNPSSWWDGQLKPGWYRFTAVVSTLNSRDTGGEYVSLSFPGAQIAVPEPGAILLLTAGMAGILLRRRCTAS